MTEVYGLVLCGGQSSRMGTDKSQLNYHGISQQQYMFNLLNKHLSHVYISQKDRPDNEHVISDKYDIKSPLNGILSAFKYNKDVAWLVVACDMPLIQSSDVRRLIDERDATHLATCYAGTDNMPHPLFTIYEPTAKDKLIRHSRKSHSPRNFLLNHSVKVIDVQDKSFLTSVDTLEQFDQLKKKL